MLGSIRYPVTFPVGYPQFHLSLQRGHQMVVLAMTIILTSFPFSETPQGRDCHPSSTMRRTNNLRSPLSAHTGERQCWRGWIMVTNPIDRLGAW